MTGNRQPAAPGERTDFDFLSDKIDAIHDRMIERIAALEKRVEELDGADDVRLATVKSLLETFKLLEKRVEEQFEAMGQRTEWIARLDDRLDELEDTVTQQNYSVRDAYDRIDALESKAAPDCHQMDHEALDFYRKRYANEDDPAPAAQPERGEKITLHRQAPAFPWLRCLAGVVGTAYVDCVGYEHRTATFDAAQQEWPLTQDEANQILAPPAQRDEGPGERCACLHPPHGTERCWSSWVNTATGTVHYCHCGLKNGVTVVPSVSPAPEHPSKDWPLDDPCTPNAIVAGCSRHDKPAAPPTKEPRRWTLHSVRGNPVYLCNVENGYCGDCFDERVHGTPAERIAVIEESAAPPHAAATPATPIRPIPPHFPPWTWAQREKWVERLYERDPGK